MFAQTLSVASVTNIRHDDTNYNECQMMILMEQNYEIYLKRSLQAVGESPLRSLTRLQQGQRARRYHHHHHHHHPCHHHPHLHPHLHCDQIKVNINIAVTITSIGLHT